jgi:hypothetical protein
MASSIDRTLIDCSRMSSRYAKEFWSGRTGRHQPLTPVGLGVWNQGHYPLFHKKTVRLLATTWLRPEAALRLCSLTFALTLLFVTSCASDPRPRVLATLSDGQRLYGRLATATFRLDTTLGELEFDRAVAGELAPEDDHEATATSRRVRLWLRDGSEFVGVWQSPAVELELIIGDERRALEIPIARLARLQFAGDPVWPEGQIGRITTREGDDFFVVVTREQLAIESDLGHFQPRLDEISSIELASEDPRRWRIALAGGTVLHGTIAQEHLALRTVIGAVALALPLGRLQRFMHHRLEPIGIEWHSMSAATAAPPTGADESERGYYSNQMQKAAKQQLDGSGATR